MHADCQLHTRRLLAGVLRAPPPTASLPPTRGEYKACLPCGDLTPAAARPLRPARARQVSAQAAILGAERLKGGGPVTRFFCPGQLSGVSLADDVSKPWLRNVPFLAGDRMPGCPAPFSCAASWGRAPLPSRAVHRARARDWQPRAATTQPGCPLKKRRWRRALSPPGPESPRTCEGLETGLTTGRGGKSGAGTCATRARPPPHLPATCTGAPFTGAPAGGRARTGRGAAAWSREQRAGRPALGSWGAAGRVPSGDRQGLPHSARVSPCGARGWDLCDALRPPGCKSLCKPLIVTVIFATMCHPGRWDVVVFAAAAAAVVIWEQMQVCW